MEEEKKDRLNGNEDLEHEENDEVLLNGQVHYTNISENTLEINLMVFGAKAESMKQIIKQKKAHIVFAIDADQTMADYMQFAIESIKTAVVALIEIDHHNGKLTEAKV